MVVPQQPSTFEVFTFHYISLIAASNPFLVCTLIQIWLDLCDLGLVWKVSFSGLLKEGGRWPGGKESTCQGRKSKFDPRVRKVTLEKGMTTHSNILAWEIPLTEEPGRLQSMGSQRVKHNWARTHTRTHKLARRKFPGSPVIRTQRFHCLGPDSSLVRELRSQKPYSQKIIIN